MAYLLNIDGSTAAADNFGLDTVLEAVLGLDLVLVAVPGLDMVLAAVPGLGMVLALVAVPGLGMVLKAGLGLDLVAGPGLDMVLVAGPGLDLEGSQGSIVVVGMADRVDNLVVGVGSKGGSKDDRGEEGRLGNFEAVHPCFLGLAPLWQSLPELVHLQMTFQSQKNPRLL